MSSHEIVDIFLLLPDSFKFSSDIELKSLSHFLVSQTEGKGYNDAKKMFDSAYTLSKKPTNSDILCCV